MENLALYRKYRPGEWKDVLGQEHIVDVISGSIKNGKIAHAYLFSGPRGTGKTSIARILASSIGCRGSDLYEIDGASNRGIDEIRALREMVGTLPMESPYKVYIIDEAHMLTKDAFNALLKTLEEPPVYVVFILATTEHHKLPETVISRCQHFSFKKPSGDMLCKLVLDIAEKEGFQMDKESAALIALLGDGSFRDTHGILQKVISSANGKEVSIEDVRRVTGAPRFALVRDFIDALSRKNVEMALTTVRIAARDNIDMKIFIKLIMRSLRIALLMKYVSNMKDEYKDEILPEEHEFLLGLSPSIGPGGSLNSVTMHVLIDAYKETSGSFIPELPLELAAIKLAAQEKK